MTQTALGIMVGVIAIQIGLHEVMIWKQENAKKRLDASEAQANIFDFI